MKKISLAFFAIFISVVLFFFGFTQLVHRVIESDKDVRTAAMERVNLFQEMYNKGDFLIIYNQTTDEFKRITPKESFYLLMQRKKEVLGDFISSSLVASNVINSNAVIVTYRSLYANYSLVEEFQYLRKSKNDAWQLGTYFIDDGGKRGEVIKNEIKLKVME